MNTSESIENSASISSIKDGYIQIGVFCEYHDLVCIHARNRKDMKEVYLWLYKNRFCDNQRIEEFYSHIKKFIRSTKNNITDYGIDSKGTAYVAVEKSDATLLANIVYNNAASEKIIFNIIDIISKLNSKGIYHGMFTEYSFMVDTDTNVYLIEPLGLNCTEQLIKSSNIDPKYYRLESKSDVYSLGSLIYKLCAKETLPVFYNKEQNQQFINNVLQLKLENKATEWVKYVLESSLQWDQRIESVKDLKNTYTNYKDIRDSAIHEFTDKIIFSKFFWPIAIIATIFITSIITSNKINANQAETNISTMDKNITIGALNSGFNNNSYQAQKYQEQKMIIDTLKIEPEITEPVAEPIKIEYSYFNLWKFLEQKDLCKNYFVK